MAKLMHVLMLGDRVNMRKPHPCGGFQWEVVRLGADIKVRCETCDRRVMMSRSELAKRVKTVEQLKRGRK